MSASRIPDSEAFASAGAYWRWLADYVNKRGLG